MFRRIIRGINDFITMIVVFVLMIIAAYACYALWDNAQIYQEASNVQEDMKRLKPLENEEESPSFAELLKIKHPEFDVKYFECGEVYSYTDME